MLVYTKYNVSYVPLIQSLTFISCIKIKVLNDLTKCIYIFWFQCINFIYFLLHINIYKHFLILDWHSSIHMLNSYGKKASLYSINIGHSFIIFLIISSQ